MLYFLSLILLFFMTFHGLHAEIFAGIHYGKNEGEYIEELGSKFPSFIPGFAGGSRITYPLNSSLYGVNFVYNRAPFSILIDAETSPIEQRNSGARDEDFTMNQLSTVKTGKLNPAQGKYYDTAYTFTGTNNFADAQGGHRFRHSQGSLRLRWYPLATENRSGFFISVGGAYNRFFHNIHNVTQYYKFPYPMLLPLPGTVLTLNGGRVEGFIGIGYSLKTENWLFEGSFEPLTGYERSTDNHILRFIKFQIQTVGTGFYYKALVSRRIYDSFYLGTELYGHRFYSSGILDARGGINYNDIMSNYMGSSRILMNVKESGFRVSITKKL